MTISIVLSCKLFMLISQYADKSASLHSWLFPNRTRQSGKVINNCNMPWINLLFIRGWPHLSPSGCQAPFQIASSILHLTHILDPYQTWPESVIVTTLTSFLGASRQEVAIERSDVTSWWSLCGTSRGMARVSGEQFGSIGFSLPSAVSNFSDVVEPEDTVLEMWNGR